MHSALAPLRHHPRPLQQPFHPAVADLYLVLLLQLLVKVPNVQIEVLLPIQPQDFLHHRHRHPLGRWLTPPPVKQSSEPELFIALAPAPHLPVADPYDLSRLPPRDLLRHGSQDHFLYLHRPLHCGLRVRHHAFHGLLPSPPAKRKRTLHLLSQPDISCANDAVTLVLDNRRPASYRDLSRVRRKSTSVHHPEKGRGYEKNSRPRAEAHSAVRILPRWFCLDRCV